MNITVSINEVLRDILGRFQLIYEKYYQEVKSDVVTPDLMQYIHFSADTELYDFLYEESPMEIFGQAKESENNVIRHLVELYKKMPSDYKLTLVTDDFGRSKASTLWFLAKYGCCCDEIKFYNINTIETIWDYSDVVITADKEIISCKPENKKLIVVDRVFNQEVTSDKRINNLKEIESFENI